MLFLEYRDFYAAVAGAVGFVIVRGDGFFGSEAAGVDVVVFADAYLDEEAGDGGGAFLGELLTRRGGAR